MASVFEAFKRAVITDDWKLGLITVNTDIGKTWKDLGFKSVIVDESARGELENAPNADSIYSDTLLYAMPSEMPGLNVAKYIASYYWYQKSSDQYYQIIEVGVGKNQHSGEIEHIEFRLRPTEISGYDS